MPSVNFLLNVNTLNKFILVCLVAHFNFYNKNMSEVMKIYAREMLDSKMQTRSKLIV